MIVMIVRMNRTMITKMTIVSFFVPLLSRAISHMHGHLRVFCFAQQTTEKRETARSLP